tara:strand:- start:2717 stop:2923 length:207 start_codon:yes stop_codon:yes gene_type:complete
MENLTSHEKAPHIYTAEEIILILGGLGGMIASIIYAFKNIKHCQSGCMECDQKTKNNCPEIENQITNV